MALNMKETDKLMSIFDSKEMFGESFDKLYSKFSGQFSKQDNFKVGTAIVLLLQSPDLLPQKHQRLGSIFLLYEMYQRTDTQVCDNPFASVFVSLLSADHSEAIKEVSTKVNFMVDYAKLPVLTPEEKDFIRQLVTSNQPKLNKKSPKDVFTTKVKVPEPQDNDISELQLKLVARQTGLLPSVKSNASCIIPFPLPSCDSKSNSDKQSEDRKHTREALLTGSNAPVLQKFKPEFIRPIPMLHPVFDGELPWLNPDCDDDFHELMWDEKMCENPTNQVRDLLKKAMETPLDGDETEMVVKELRKINEKPKEKRDKETQKLLNQSGLSSKKLKNLVDWNPLIAIEVLAILIKTSMHNDYLAALVDMEMSLQSMEVVNRLSMCVKLPHQFINFYVVRCIKVCCKKENDKYKQSRMVRLVCVLLQSLIRNKIVDVDAIFIELQAFCIDFSKIKEAAALFRLLRSHESKAPSSGKENQK